MAIKNTQRGFALLIAVIFMTVMLSFGLALGSLSYKQQVLASTAVGSQYAFYAADSALECALYADQQTSSFVPYPTTPPSEPSISCDGVSVAALTSSSWTPSMWIINYRIPLDTTLPNSPRCADLTIYKYRTPQSDGSTTRIFSQGYDVSCSAIGSGSRFSSRGMSAHY